MRHKVRKNERLIPIKEAHKSLSYLKGFLKSMGVEPNLQSPGAKFFLDMCEPSRLEAFVKEFSEAGIIPKDIDEDLASQYADEFSEKFGKRICHLNFLIDLSERFKRWPEECIRILDGSDGRFNEVLSNLDFSISSHPPGALHKHRSRYWELLTAFFLGFGEVHFNSESQVKQENSSVSEFKVHADGKVIAVECKVVYSKKQPRKKVYERIEEALLQIESENCEHGFVFLDLTPIIKLRERMKIIKFGKGVVKYGVAPYVEFLEEENEENQALKPLEILRTEIHDFYALWGERVKNKAPNKYDRFILIVFYISGTILEFSGSHEAGVFSLNIQPYQFLKFVSALAKDKNEVEFWLNDQEETSKRFSYEIMRKIETRLAVDPATRLNR